MIKDKTTPTRTRQSVPVLRMLHETPLTQAGGSVLLEAVQADHMAIRAGEDQDHRPGGATTIGLHQVGTYKRVL